MPVKWITEVRVSMATLSGAVLHPDHFGHHGPPSAASMAGPYHTVRPASHDCDQGSPRAQIVVTVSNNTSSTSDALLALHSIGACHAILDKYDRPRVLKIGSGCCSWLPRRWRFGTSPAPKAC